MADVIDIAGHLPKADPDLIETLRIMLSEAQNGRLVSLAAVYTINDGTIDTVFHFDSALEAVGAIAMLHHEAISFLTE